MLSETQLSVKVGWIFNILNFYYNIKGWIKLLIHSQGDGQLIFFNFLAMTHDATRYKVTDL